MRDTTQVIPAPEPPAAPAPYSFPLLATVAPVVVSVAIWLITQSVFALVFAALGPAVAVASVADARLQARRRGRRETARFDAELAEARTEIAAAHRRERDALVASSPSAARLVDGGWPESEHWLGSLDTVVPVSLGRAERPSGVALDAPASRGRTAHHDRLRALVADAARLPDAPAIVDARLGVGVAGPDPLATAVARGVVLQLAASLSPLTHSLTLETAEASTARAEWLWLDELPHDLVLVDGAETVLRVQSRESPGAAVARGPSTAVVAVARRREALPRLARIVVRTGDGEARLVQHPDLAELGPLRLEPVSREQALLVARAMTEHARRARLVGGAAALPAELSFDDCGGRETGKQPSGLDCVVGVTAAGPLRLDLAAHGPHAVVGGTTGSGKSELLVAWVLAMARAHPPRAASVLLVDFKGGSAFAALAALPHCVGVITDLDETGAARALESLAAELRRRELVLAAAGAKSVDTPGAAGSVPDLPRLVIVVDEFAAMVAGFPELHALFGDIAARGRSLGVHLVLCTQRPAGVIRDAVLANSALRVSLRVNNRGDSVAVIGSDEAAALPLSPRGRAWVAADGDAPVLAQFPLVVPHDVDAVTRRWSADPYRPHRPWLDPLPGLVRAGELEPGDPGGIPFGRLDDPARQSQPTAFYRPATHGNLLVVGGAGSGKTGVLDTLVAAAASPIRASQVPHDIEGAWDLLTATLDAIRGGEVALGSTLVLLDDLDTLVSRFPEEYEGAVLELVTQGLREGPGRGIHWALTAQRLTSGLHSIAALCGSRLLLRLPTRQEYVLAGGDGEHFSSALPPGAGRWEGLRVQVARTDGAARSRPARPVPPALGLSRPLAVVSRRPAQFADRLRRGFPVLAEPGAVVLLGAEGIGVSTGTPAATVGDAQAWLSNWGSIAALRATHTVVVEGCGAGEFRSITRVAELPPPLAPTAGGGTPAAFWVLDPDGRITRATLPGETGL